LTERLGPTGRDGTVSRKSGRIHPAFRGWGVAVQNEKNGVYDFRFHGDRRKADRRCDLDRRGVLRWDPAKRERRSGWDRRQAAFYPRGG